MKTNSPRRRPIKLASLRWALNILMASCTYLPVAVLGAEEFPHLQVVFLGTDQDKVGTGYQTHPNGDPDGHFRLTVKTGGALVQLTGMWIYTSDDRGRPVSSTRPAQWWTTTGRGWILGVERDGKRLNQWDRKIDEVMSGTVEYHVFADGAAWFKRPGQYFTVGIDLADGRTLHSIIRVGVAGPLR